MIVVDSSALLAIYLNEPERSAFIQAIVGSGNARIGAPNFFEASMVAEARNGEAGCRDLDRLSEAIGLMTVSFEPDHIAAARDAFRRFGKGRHRAGLNFGDCCAYALAKTLGAPLLFKGDDFIHTDIARAAYST